MDKRIRILIADINDDYRSVMEESLNAEEDLDVIGSTGDGLKALHDGIGVEDLVVADLLRVFEVLDPVLFHDGSDLADPSLVSFKRDAHI